MGRSRRRFQRQNTSRERRSVRLPCGCDAGELAAQMGLSVDELLRAADRAERPDAGDGPVLLTLPLPGPPPDGPPDDDAHLRN